MKILIENDTGDSEELILIFHCKLKNTVNLANSFDNFGIFGQKKRKK